MATTAAPDGTTIHYETAGPVETAGEPAIVLVHGITERGAVWAPIVERLASSLRTITLDLRGHGESGPADRYDLESMAGDVAAVLAAEGLDRPHLVGHSLGGAVVTAVGAALPVASVVDVDQSLQLGAFREQLLAFEGPLRDTEAFPTVIAGLFDSMAGPLAGTNEFDRVASLRRADQTVVLGVWELILSSTEDEIAAVVDAALAGYDGVDVPYLALFGIDPGPDYGEWLASKIHGARTEVWPDHGHYPHLVDPDRFVERLHSFWTSTSPADT